MDQDSVQCDYKKLLVDLAVKLPYANGHGQKTLAEDVQNGINFEVYKCEHPNKYKNILNALKEAKVLLSGLIVDIDSYKVEDLKFHQSCRNLDSTMCSNIVNNKKNLASGFDDKINILKNKKNDYIYYELHYKYLPKSFADLVHVGIWESLSGTLPKVTDNNVRYKKAMIDLDRQIEAVNSKILKSK